MTVDLNPRININMMVKGRPEVPRKPKTPNRGIGARPKTGERGPTHAPAAPAPGGPADRGGENSLTPIPHRIHCAAAAGGGQGLDQGQVKLDQIAVNHFLDTLAQVAFSIASRKQQKGKG